MQETAKIWMNGQLVDWADATVHVGTHGLHYGSGVFEGIRAYETDAGTGVFRLTEHMERLHSSARLIYMDLPYSVEELKAATWDLIGANELPSCYLRPIAFSGYGQLGVATRDNPIDVAIMAWPWGAYLGEDGMRNGIRVKVSSWQRVGPNVIPHVAKATGVYLNSMLAVGEANRAGYDEAILLTARGVRRRRLGREHLHRQGRRHLHAGPVGVDPRRHHARHGHPDRAGSRAPRRREAADPHRPLSRGRGLHGRDGRRGDADPRGRRPRRRAARTGDGRDPAGVPRHRARAERALGPVARVRAHARRRREAGSSSDPAVGAVRRRAGGRGRRRGAALRAGSRSGRRSTASRS